MAELLRPKLGEFINKHSTPDPAPFLAVDLGAGRAVGTIQLAMAFRKPILNGNLLVYPTDYSGNDDDYSPVEVETKKSLQFHIDSHEKSASKMQETSHCFEATSSSWVG